MSAGTNPPPQTRSDPRALHAYLLGTLPPDAVAALLRRLAFDVAGDPATGAVVVCEHPRGVSIGREGSRLDLRPGPDALATRGWPVHWVGRGGGTMLHLPGQVACYPVLPLAGLGLSVVDYLRALEAVAVEVVAGSGVRAAADPARPGVVVGGRRVAHVGVAVRGGVSTYGFVLNVDPDLEPFRDVLCDGDAMPMTSIQRESPARVRMSGVRQRLVDAVAARFGYPRVSLFHSHPAVAPTPKAHAVPTPTR